ncbi:MAG: signal peptidase II [Candidatus Omnitrophica bacterium]|nr:signal peptidase II [Candidatus Omnitrophota bacterium]
MRRITLGQVRNTVLTASVVLVLDRLTKYVVMKTLSQGQSIKVVPGIFHISLVLNKGSAFGLFKGQRLLFVSLSILAVFFIISYIWRNIRQYSSISFALGLILAGAIGNLIDRLAFGYVIDFLDFRIWPVFNIADSAIPIGTMIFIWKILKRKRCIPSS